MPDLPPSFAPANPRPRPKLERPEARTETPERQRDQASAHRPAPAVPRTGSPVSAASPVSPASATSPASVSSAAEPPGTGLRRILPARLDRRTPPVHVPEPAASSPVVSTGLADRLAERRAALKARRVRLVAIGAAAVVLLGFAGWIVGFSPWLALEESEITITGGSEQASTQEIAEHITPAVGTPLARLDTGAMVEGIESIIGVKEVTISRSWPHGLQVDVVARKPVAAVKNSDEYVVVDADGVELNHLAEAPEGLPVVNVPIDETTGETVTGALTVMAALPGDVEVSEVAATGPDGIRLTLADGATVEWGSADDSEMKAAVLETLLQVGAEVYNVAEPLSPTTS